MTSKTLAYYLRETLSRIGIHKVFTIPGAHIEPLLIELVQDDRFDVVICAHEEGAGYMADGYSSKTKEPSLVLTINGPGASNLATAVATSVSNGSPIIYITGDVPRSVQNVGGFQSSQDYMYNTLALFEALLGPSIVLKPGLLEDGLSQFVASIKTKNYHPIHVNIPVDQFRKTWESSSLEILERHIESTPEQIDQDFASAEIGQMLLVIGDHFQFEDEIKLLCELCVKHQIPMAYTLGSKRFQAIIPPELDWGVFGYSGYESTYLALFDERLTDIFTLGMEFNERNTYTYHEHLMKTKRFHVWHPDKRAYPSFDLESIYVYQSFQTFIHTFNKAIDSRMNAMFQRVNAHEKDRISDEFNVENLVRHLNDLSNESVCLFLDSGDHRIYGSRYWRSKSIRGFYTASKNAPMGWAIAAGIGASFDSQPVVVITGDGCMLMHGNEIAVAARYQKQVIFIVVKNNQYGRIAKRLNSLEIEEVAEIANLPKVDWVMYAQSLDVPATSVDSLKSLEVAFKQALDRRRPFLIEACVTEDTQLITTISSTGSPTFHFSLMEDIYE